MSIDQDQDSAPATAPEPTAPGRAPGHAQGLMHALALEAEEAGMNASAPAEQLWLDGWLLRRCPVKAKRARCIYPLAPGRLPLAERLARARTLYAEAGLPLVLRLHGLLGAAPPGATPAPAAGTAAGALADTLGGLDRALAALGLQTVDDTRVMLQADLPAAAAALAAEAALPAGCRIGPCGPVDFAAVVGGLRGSPAGQVEAHGRRLAAAAVRHHGHVLHAADGRLLACGQFTCELGRAGLFDVFVPAVERGRGWSRRFCAALLLRALSQGATLAYLQVEADNAPARAVYRRLGFADAYAYHYRCDDPARV